MLAETTRACGHDFPSAGRGAMSVPDTVCIVDDDEDMRKVLVHIVRSVGLAAEPFDSAEAFLTRRPDVRVSCLLVDVELKGMSGVALLEALGDGKRDFPVFLISGAHDALTTESAKRRSAIVVDKPFDARSLAQRIRAAVRAASD
jgi:FixJ family two-component response regulator